MKDHIKLVIGSYAEKGQPGIYIFDFDTEGGNITPVSHISDIENPSYVCVSSDSTRIYGISEFKEGDIGKASFYTWSANKTFSRSGSELTYPGAGSCYVSTDLEERYLFIANYGQGTLVVLPIFDGKELGKPAKIIEFEGSGPDKERQEQPHIHCALLSPEGNYLYCTDLGTDRLYHYRFNTDSPEILSPVSSHFLHLPPGSGPRHISFSISKRWMYVITEMSGQLFVFELKDKLDDWIQQISLAAEGYDGKMEGGDLQVHPGGKYLYASNRGEANQIVTYQIDDDSGRLTVVQHISSYGRSPRGLAIDPTGNFLFAANEQSDNVTVFKIDASTGQLSFTGIDVQISKPSCLKFLFDPPSPEHF